MVLFDLSFHGVKPIVSFIGILHIAQGIDLVFQIMVSDIDKFHAFLIIAIIVILVPKQSVDVSQFPSDMYFSHMSLIGIQDCNPSKIYQGADIKYVLDDVSAEGRTGYHKA